VYPLSPLMALNGLYCADVPLSTYSVSQSCDLWYRYMNIIACQLFYAIVHQSDSLSAVGLWNPCM